MKNLIYILCIFSYSPFILANTIDSLYLKAQEADPFEKGKTYYQYYEQKLNQKDSIYSKDVGKFWEAYYQVPQESWRIAIKYKFAQLLMKSSDTADLFIKKLIRESELTKNDSVVLKSHLLLNYYYSRKNQLDSAKTYLLKGLSLPYLDQYPSQKCMLLKNLGKVTYHKEELNLSMKYYLQALDYALQENQKKNVIDIYNGIANIFVKEQNYTYAEQYYLDAIAYNKKNQLNYDATLYLNYGLTLFYMQKYDEAIKYYNLCLDYNNSAVYQLYVYSFLGDVYFEKEMYEKAKEYYEKNIATQSSKLNKERYLITSKFKIELCNYNLSGKTNAYPDFHLYLKQIESNNLKALAISMAAYYFAYTEQYKRVIDLKKNITLLNDYPYEKLKYYQSLVEAYEKTHQYTKAYTLLKQIKSKEDSLHLANEEKKLELKNKIYDFEKLQQQNEIKITQQQLRIESQEKEIIQKKAQLILFVLFSILCVVLSVSYYVYTIQKTNNLKRKLDYEENIRRASDIIEGEELEKRETSEYIHEQLSQDLVYVRNSFSMALEPTLQHENANLLLNSLDNTIQQLREVSYHLAPPSLHLFSLSDAIQQYCKGMSNSQLALKFISKGKKLKLGKKKSTALYRIIQELVKNIKQHANATRGSIILDYQKNTLAVIIKDNGNGSSPDLWKDGLGWKRIRYRLALLNATYTIKSDENGTIIMILIHELNQ